MMTQLNLQPSIIIHDSTRINLTSKLNNTGCCLLNYHHIVEAQACSPEKFVQNF